MLTLDILLQQLDLELSPEQRRSLWTGISMTSPLCTAEAQAREIGWHIDKADAIFASGAMEIFFDRFGRHCGHLAFATLDEGAEARLLQGELLGAEAFLGVSDTHAWILEGGFLYGAICEGRRTLQRALASHGLKAIGYIHRRRSGDTAKVIQLPDTHPAPAVSEPAYLRTWPAQQLRHEAQSWIAERTTMGAAAALLAGSPRFRALKLDDAVSLLLGLVTLGQYQLATEASGRPIGFRSWGYFTDFAVERLSSQGPRALSDGCWNQGTRKTLVCDWRAPQALSTVSAWTWEKLPDSRYSIHGASAA